MTDESAGSDAGLTDTEPKVPGPPLQQAVDWVHANLVDVPAVGVPVAVTLVAATAAGIKQIYGSVLQSRITTTFGVPSEYVAKPGFDVLIYIGASLVVLGAGVALALGPGRRIARSRLLRNTLLVCYLLADLAVTTAATVTTDPVRYSRPATALTVFGFFALLIVPFSIARRVMAHEPGGHQKRSRVTRARSGSRFTRKFRACAKSVWEPYERAWRRGDDAVASQQAVVPMLVFAAGVGVFAALAVVYGLIALIIGPFFGKQSFYALPGSSSGDVVLVFVKGDKAVEKTVKLSKDGVIESCGTLRFVESKGLEVERVRISVPYSAFACASAK